MHSMWLFNQYILGVGILVLEYYFGTGYIFGGYFGYIRKFPTYVPQDDSQISGRKIFWIS